MKYIKDDQIIRIAAFQGVSAKFIHDAIEEKLVREESRLTQAAGNRSPAVPPIRSIV